MNPTTPDCAKMADIRSQLGSIAAQCGGSVNHSLPLSDLADFARDCIQNTLEELDDAKSEIEQHLEVIDDLLLDADDLAHDDNDPSSP